MLEQSDFKVFQKMLDQAFARNNGMLRLEFRQMNEDLRNDMRAMKSRLIHRMDRLKVETVSEVTDFIGDTLLSQLDELQTDMVVVKKHLRLT